MAKRGILDHPKTLELSALLDIPECYVVGILECVWQWVAKHRPTGDLSEVRPLVFARSIRYPGDAQGLMDALVSAGFLDRSEAGQVWVHDWSEHADDAVHIWLARHRQRFADGSIPRLGRLSTKEREEAERAYNAPEAPAVRKPEPPSSTEGGTCAHKERTECAQREPCLSHGLSLSPCPEVPTHPSGSCVGEPVADAPAHTEPPPATPPPKRSRSEPPGTSERWQEFLKLYPSRSGDRCVAKGREKFGQLLRAGVDVEAILEGVRRYAEWVRKTGKTGTEFVKQIPTWLNNRAWEEPWTAGDETDETRSQRSSDAGDGRYGGHRPASGSSGARRQDRRDRDAADAVEELRRIRQQSGAEPLYS